jgi:hypothetical protein
MTNPLTLQAVIVHKGQEVTKGHYVVFTKMVGSPGWALCNDDNVHWVSEMEALAQEAVIRNTKEEQPADQSEATGQPGTVLDRGWVQHPEASPLTELETLIQNMTIHDAQPSLEETREAEYGLDNRVEAEASPLTGLETLIENMTIHDVQPSSNEMSGAEGGRIP